MHQETLKDMFKTKCTGLPEFCIIRLQKTNQYRDPLACNEHLQRQGAGDGKVAISAKPFILLTGFKYS